MKETLSIIIPVYGEKELVPILYNRLINNLKKIPVNYNVIYINDCCPFGSGEELEKLAKIDKNVKIINFTRNFGEASAVKAGIDLCNSDWAIIMDCDLQDRPEDIPLLYNKAKEGFDVVWGERIKRKDSFFKKFCSQAFYFINNTFSEIKINKKIGSFSIISKDVIKELKKIDTYTFNYIQMVEYLGFKKAYIPTIKNSREIGKSGYSFIKGTLLATKIMISNSNKPLLIPIISSFIMFILCFILITMNIINTIKFDKLTFLILFLFCILFVNLSIISLYIGIILKEVLKKPKYVIKNENNINNPKF